MSSEMDDEMGGDDGAMVDEELEGLDRELGLRLRSLLDPAGDLARRTSMDVDRTLRGGSVLATAFDLIGLGAWTARALLTDPPRDADQKAEGI